MLMITVSFLQSHLVFTCIFWVLFVKSIEFKGVWLNFIVWNDHSVDNRDSWNSLQRVCSNRALRCATRWLVSEDVQLELVRFMKILIVFISQTYGHFWCHKNGLCIRLFKCRFYGDATFSFERCFLFDALICSHSVVSLENHFSSGFEKTLNLIGVDSTRLTNLNIKL